MDAKNLYKHIMSLPSKERINLLTNDIIRKRLLEDDAHYPFVWIVQQLKGKELKYFIDEKYLGDILSNNKSIDKINAIMSSCNEYATDILLDDRVVSLILDSSTSLHTYLYNLDYRMGQKIIDYDIKNSTNHFSMLSSFNAKQQLEIIDTDYIIKLLKYKELPDRFLTNLSGCVVEKLLDYDKFQTMFLDSTVYDINILINHNLVIPKRLFDSRVLIDKYVNLDTNRYRYYVNNLMIRNYEFYDIVEKERFKYVDNVVNSIDNDILSKYKSIDKNNVFNNYDFQTASKMKSIINDKEKLDEFLKYSTKEKLLEMIIDLFFKDVSYNFLKNLKAIINYSKANPKFIPSNLDIYNTILSFNALSTDDIVNFFNTNKSKDLASAFYEDFRKARNISYQEINNGITKFDKSSSLYKKDISNEFGIDIYELNGEDFYLYIHSSRSGRWMNNKKTLCLSLISHNSINTIDNEEVIFGFSKLNIDNIMHMYHSDSFSAKEAGTHKVHDIETKENLINKTTSYNEILYKENDNFKPDFIVCFDIIDDEQVAIAREMNIPIVLINSKRYVKKNGKLEGLEHNNYLSGNEVDDYDILEDIKCK